MPKAFFSFAVFPNYLLHVVLYLIKLFFPDLNKVHQACLRFIIFFIMDRRAAAASILVILD